jgi:hypothetical protein
VDKMDEERRSGKKWVYGIVEREMMIEIARK